MYWVRGYFILGLSICAFIIMARAVHLQLKGVSHYAVVFDPLFSQDLQKHIHTSIKNSLNMDPISLCTAIKKQYPTIKDILYQHKQQKKIILTISAYRPVFVLNDASVLLESGIIEDKNAYIDSSMQDLYHITLKSPQNTLCTVSCMNWFEQNAFTIFDYFNVQWLDATTIVLSDKNSSDFNLLCNEQTRICHTLIKTCFQLKDALKKTTPIARGQQCYWCADIRFDNQIILYRKRGKYEGHSVFS